MSKKAQIVADASFFTAMSLLTQAITLCAAILTRRFLGPEQTGVWSLLQVILVYAAYSSLGVTEAVSREIPYYLGKGDSKKADEIKDLIFSFASLTSALVSATCVIWALIARESLAPEYFWGLIVMSALVQLQRASNLRIGFLRGYKLFSLAAKLMVVSAIANGLLVAFFSYRFKVYGFMIAMILSFIFNIFFIERMHRFRFGWRFDWPRIWELIKYGFPISLVSIVGVFFVTIDKLMIAHWLGVRELGLYSVAILAYTYLGHIPNSTGIVLIPNFHQKYGETQKIDDLRTYVEKLSDVLTIVMPVLIASVWFVIPYLARIVLPDFEGSIGPMRYLVLSAYYVALINPYSYFIVVVRKQLYLVPIISSACIVAFIANWIAIDRGYGILGVGIATTIATGFKFAATYFWAYRYMDNAKGVWRVFFNLNAKFVYMCSVLLVLQAVFPKSEFTLWKVLAQCLCLGLIYLPGLRRLNREFDLVKTISMKLSSLKFVVGKEPKEISET